MEHYTEPTEASPRYAIKISVDSSPDEIIEKFKNKGLVQFIVTGNDDVWLSSKGHDSMRMSNDILWADTVTRGYVQRKDLQLGVWYYADPPEGDTKHAVSFVLTKYFEDQVGKGENIMTP